jgi:ABC-type antimicrobial peptide transport system permease subunit
MEKIEERIEEVVVEEIKDDVEEDKEIKVSKEDLEELLQEDNQEVNASALRNFLINQNTNPSLDQIAMAPVETLESNVKMQPHFEPEEEKDKIEYNLFKEFEQGNYQTQMQVEATFQKPDLSPTEKILEEQKRLMSSVQAMSPELRDQKRPENDYIRPEDTKKDYFTKLKFERKR